MSMTYRWVDQTGADTDLGNQVVRLGSLSGFNTDATGTGASSTIAFDDPAGTLAIVGLRTFYVTESAAPAGNQVIFHGRFGIRRVKRMTSTSLITGAARSWDCDIIDDTADLSNYIITGTDGNRPAETAAARVTWLLGSSYVTVHDYGNVHSPSLSMDAVDYRGQTAADVLGDVSTQSGYNFFAYYDESHAALGLWLDDPASSNDSSTMQISNVLADVDNVTTFYPYDDAQLERDPTRVASGVWLTHAKGTVYVQDTGTASEYAHIDRSAPMANVKTAAAGTAAANRFLSDNATEDDKITVTVRVPAAHVNDARAGQRLQVKFSHLPGYTAYTYCRILNRSVMQDEQDDTYYKITYTLSPQTQPYSYSVGVLTVTITPYGAWPVNTSGSVWSDTITVELWGGPSLSAMSMIFSDAQLRALLNGTQVVTKAPVPAFATNYKWWQLKNVEHRVVASSFIYFSGTTWLGVQVFDANGRDVVAGQPATVTSSDGPGAIFFSGTPPQTLAGDYGINAGVDGAEDRTITATWAAARIP